VHLKRRLHSTQARCDLNLDENMNSGFSCSCLLCLVLSTMFYMEDMSVKIVLIPVNWLVESCCFSYSTNKFAYVCRD
jgi:hypothetical protein